MQICLLFFMLPLYCIDFFFFLLFYFTELKSAEASQFDVVLLIDFCFYCLYFLCHIQKIAAKTNVRFVFFLFSSRFTVSNLMFKSLIHFEIIFVSGVR